MPRPSVILKRAAYTPYAIRLIAAYGLSLTQSLQTHGGGLNGFKLLKERTYHYEPGDQSPGRLRLSTAHTGLPDIRRPHPVMNSPNPAYLRLGNVHGRVEDVRIHPLGPDVVPRVIPDLGDAFPIARHEWYIRRSQFCSHQY